MGPLTNRTVLSWSYDLTNGKFLFLQSNGEEYAAATISPEHFEALTSISRISPHPGRVFSIMGAPVQPRDKRLLLHTRGMVLANDPFILSGISEEVEPEELGYYFDPGSEEVVNILSDGNNRSARNIVHALKAPINRIKGIASILEEELDSEQHLELIDFLRESNDRLASLANYLLEARKRTENQNALTAVQLIENVGTLLEAWLPKFPEIKGKGGEAIIEPHLIQPLERLLVNLLTHEPPGNTGLKTIRIDRNQGGTISVEVTHSLQVTNKAVASEPYEVEDLPSGGVELIRADSNALILRSLDKEQLTHRIIVPVVS